MRLTAFVAATSLVLIGCPTPPITPPVPPPDTDLCSAMCVHLARLGCEEGEPVYNNDLPGPVDVPNQSCAAACEEWQDKGVFVNPRCVALVTDCGQIEKFRQREPETCPSSGPN